MLSILTVSLTSSSPVVKWKRRLSQSDDPGPAFVEWVAPSPTTEPTSGPGEFELSLPGGVVLRWKA